MNPNKKFWLGAFFFLGLVLLAGAGFTQEAAEAARGKVETKTLWELLKTGGIVMVLIFICSAAWVALTIQGFVTLRLVYVIPPPFLAKVREQIGQGDYEAAAKTCLAAKPQTLFTKSLGGALSRLHRGRHAVDTALEEHVNAEANALRARNSYLATIATITPMLGLLGSVTGMIKAFQTIGVAGTSDPSRLADNISEVLITTAGGLFVAVPAFVSYFYFRNRIQQVTLVAENQINELIEDLPFEQLAGETPAVEQPVLAPVGAPSAIPEPVAARPATASLTAAPPPRPATAAIAAGGPRVRAATVMVGCPNCNAQIPQGSPQCGACGAALEWD